MRNDTMYVNMMASLSSKLIVSINKHKQTLTTTTTTARETDRSVEHEYQKYQNATNQRDLAE